MCTHQTFLLIDRFSVCYMRFELELRTLYQWYMHHRSVYHSRLVPIAQLSNYNTQNNTNQDFCRMKSTEKMISHSAILFFQLFFLSIVFPYYNRYISKYMNSYSCHGKNASGFLSYDYNQCQL